MASLGLAAALDEYEHAPHGELRLLLSRRIAPQVCPGVSPSETDDPECETQPQTRWVSHPPELPDIVNRAFDVARRAGYVSFCRNETGRLLAMLAASRDGTMAEFGTGCGVGTAWLRSGVRGEKARIITAELDPKLAKAASEILIGRAHV